jgi:hypothetical protein
MFSGLYGFLVLVIDVLLEIIFFFLNASLYIFLLVFMHHIFFT